MAAAVEDDEPVMEQLKELGRRLGHVSSALGDALNCRICMGMFTDPAVTPCGHHFCHNCIMTTITRYNKPCPLCTTKLDRRSLRRDATINTLVTQFRRLPPPKTREALDLGEDFSQVPSASQMAAGFQDALCYMDDDSFVNDVPVEPFALLGVEEGSSSSSSSSGGGAGDDDAGLLPLSVVAPAQEASEDGGLSVMSTPPEEVDGATIDRVMEASFAIMSASRGRGGAGEEGGEAASAASSSSSSSRDGLFLPPVSDTQFQAALASVGGSRASATGAARSAAASPAPMARSSPAAVAAAAAAPVQPFGWAAMVDTQEEAISDRQSDPTDEGSSGGAAAAAPAAAVSRASPAAAAAAATVEEEPLPAAPAAKRRKSNAGLAKPGAAVEDAAEDARGAASASAASHNSRASVGSAAGTKRRRSSAGAGLGGAAAGAASSEDAFVVFQGPARAAASASASEPVTAIAVLDGGSKEQGLLDQLLALRCPGVVAADICTLDRVTALQFSGAGVAAALRGDTRGGQPVPAALGGGASSPAAPPPSASRRRSGGAAAAAAEVSLPAGIPTHVVVPVVDARLDLAALAADAERWAEGGAAAGGAGAPPLPPGAAVSVQLARRRTQRYLCALLSGAVLVTPAWLEACIRTEGIVHEQPYLVAGDKVCPCPAPMLLGLDDAQGKLAALAAAVSGGAGAASSSGPRGRASGKGAPTLAPAVGRLLSTTVAPARAAAAGAATAKSLFTGVTALMFGELECPPKNVKGTDVAQLVASGGGKAVFGVRDWRGVPPSATVEALEGLTSVAVFAEAVAAAVRVAEEDPIAKAAAAAAREHPLSATPFSAPLRAPASIVQLWKDVVASAVSQSAGSSSNRGRPALIIVCDEPHLTLPPCAAALAAALPGSVAMVPPEWVLDCVSVMCFLPVARH